MEKTRLLNKPEDYKKIGVKKDRIEPWEDGRRDDSRPNAFEWWYFDSILDDGTKIMVAFYDKPLLRSSENGLIPHVELRVTFPDGKDFVEFFDHPSDESEFPRERCDLKIGPHKFVGDLKEYTIQINPINGLGADLKLKSLGQSWRPGAGYLAFGDKDEDYLTWLCCVPKGEVTGTITVNGKTSKVHGYGYHDHQRGSIYPLFIFNHWIWIRQNVGEYNILVFDFLTSQKYGYKRYPLCFIQDKDGNIIFENFESAKFEVIEEYLQELTGKYHPKRFKYTFENGGKTVEYTINSDAELEVRDEYKIAAETTQAVYDALQMQPSYTRYSATGELIIKEGADEIKASSSLIYEMVYSTKEYKELALT